MRLIRCEKGQVLVLVTLFMGSLLGMGALAIDMGNLYVAKSSLQKAADAGVLAGATGLPIDQTTAVARATNIANQNIAAHNTINGATTTVTFPTANTIRVTVSHPAVNLFLGGIVGINTAAVSATAVATLNPAGAAPGLVPLAIACNQPGGCTVGDLPFNTPMTLQRFCGNFFTDGADGSACGNPIGDGELFLQGITITQDSQSNDVFRDEVYDGYHGDLVELFDQVGALPGNRGGWKDGMIDRLFEGRNEMTIAVIRPVGDGLTMEVIDFLRIRVSNFQAGAPLRTDFSTFEILEQVDSNALPGNPGQGLGTNSLLTVRLTE